MIFHLNRNPRTGSLRPYFGALRIGSYAQPTRKPQLTYGHKKRSSTQRAPINSVGVPGLEPGKAGPESAVLPITPYPSFEFCFLLSPHLTSSILVGWGTRTRTRKGRTRICSVANYTIPQTSRSSRPSLDNGCKISGFSVTHQISDKLFSKKVQFSFDLPFHSPILPLICR